MTGRGASRGPLQLGDCRRAGSGLTMSAACRGSSQAGRDRSSTALQMKKISPLAAIFLTVFVDLVGFGIIVPLLPFYAEHFHASPETVTLLMAIYSLMQFFSAPLWGALSDRHGRKPVLLASLLGIGLSYLWLAFAHTLWALFAARALARIMAGNIAAPQAYTSAV